MSVLATRPSNGHNMTNRNHKRPNIIYMMSDDHAAHAISAYSPRLMKTPHLDRLAHEGAKLNNAFCTNSICAPSRAAILTGTYNHVNRVRTIWEDLDNRLPTFVTALHDAGYHTAIFGKWHLGHGPLSDPTDFDAWEVLPGQGDYIDPEFITAAGTVRKQGYVTTIITDLAMDWIDGLGDDEPFCLLVHHKAPHLPWFPDEKHKTLFADENLPEPDTLHEDLTDRIEAVKRARMNIAKHMPAWSGQGDAPEGLSERERQSWAYQQYIKDYLRCIASIDENTGRLLDFLDERGLTDDTLIIYTSDQGFFLGEHGWYDKRFMYEESLRMPFLIRYPREIAAGSVVDAMVTNVDFAQTLCDFAGVEMGAETQGRSFREVLRGETPEDWQDAVYYRYWEHEDPIHNTTSHYGIRTERYKLIYYYADGMGIPFTGPTKGPIEWELFDLKSDAQETRNLYDDPAYFDIRESLKLRLAELQRRIGDEPWEPGKRAATNIVTGERDIPAAILDRLPQWVREETWKQV